MKKYFIAALALVAAVACSKDDVSDPILNNSMKSVTISIANMEQTTRGEEYIGGETTPGSETAGLNCTKIDENFYFMFAKANGEIVTVYEKDYLPKPNGTTYTFHKLSEEICTVAVVGNYTQTPEIGKNISEYKAEAISENEYTVKDDYKNLVVYAESKLNSNGVCVVNETDGSIHEYPLYTATLDVKPAMSRIEIGQISCTNFGPEGMKYSHIGIESIILNGTDGGDKYIHNFGSFSDDDDLSYNTEFVLTSDKSVIKPENNKVWSWNIKPQAKSNLVTNIYVKGNGFTTQVPVRTVTINKYMDGTTEITNFEAGVIYKLNIDFAHNNIDGTSDYLCANVTVNIIPWTVKNVNVGFQTN